MEERCEKVSYESRAVARRARQRIGTTGLSAYRCTVCPHRPWHLGHLSLRVRAGLAARLDVYPPRA